MQKNTIILPTGIKTKIRKGKIQVTMPDSHNRSDTFIKLMVMAESHAN